MKTADGQHQQPTSVNPSYKAIEIRRRAKSDEEIYEALRLMGQALHTLEDLSAHSNWVNCAD